MKRIIAMVRTSTDKQSTEDQRNEMIEFCKSEGYDESEIELVETQGASAYKVDDEYKAMIAKIRQIISDDPSGIQALAVWHINRAFRNEEEYIHLKTFLVNNHVNLIVKNPYIKLLTPTGEINPGMELAAGLLAILSKQENEERIAKFRRTKKSNAEKGIYNGGIVKYGYMVDNGYVVPEPDETDVVRLIYELYATGKYSMASLARELSDRGIKARGNQITPDMINHILSDTAYIGFTDSEAQRSHRKYIAIVGRELRATVVKIREGNRRDIARTGIAYLGSGIVKCPVCGCTLHREANHYACWHRNINSRAAFKGNKCSYSLFPPLTPTDSILWNVASDYHAHHLVSMSREDIGEYKEHLDVVVQKIETIEGKIDKLDRKRTKVIDSYIEGYYDKTERNERLAKLADEKEQLVAKLDELCHDRNKTQELIDKLSNIEGFVKTVGDLMLSVLQERDKTKMAEICRTYIISCTVERTQFGKPDPRSSKPNALEYKINTVDGYTYRYLYLPCSQQGNKYYAWNGKEYEPTMLDIIP